MSWGMIFTRFIAKSHDNHSIIPAGIALTHLCNILWFYGSVKMSSKLKYCDAFLTFAQNIGYGCLLEPELKQVPTIYVLDPK